VAAGEYGYDETYFATMVAAEAVDLPPSGRDSLRGLHLLAAHRGDCRVTRPPGVGALRSELHHVATAVPTFATSSTFHDHHRIETMLFDGALDPRGGVLIAADRPGHGLALRTSAAEEYRVR